MHFSLEQETGIYRSCVENWTVFLFSLPFILNIKIQKNKFVVSFTSFLLILEPSKVIKQKNTSQKK